MGEIWRKGRDGASLPNRAPEVRWLGSIFDSNSKGASERYLRLFSRRRARRKEYKGRSKHVDHIKTTLSSSLGLWILEVAVPIFVKLSEFGRNG